MGVGAGLYMCDVVKKVHVRYLISWWVLVIHLETGMNVLCKWAIYLFICWWSATASAAFVARLGAVADWWCSSPMANTLACLCSCQWCTIWTYLVTVSLFSLYLMNFVFHTTLDAVCNIIRVHYESVKCGTFHVSRLLCGVVVVVVSVWSVSRSPTSTAHQVSRVSNVCSKNDALNKVQSHRLRLWTTAAAVAEYKYIW